MIKELGKVFVRLRHECVCGMGDEAKAIMHIEELRMGKNNAGGSSLIMVMTVTAESVQVDWL